MSAEELIRDGKVDEALAALQQEVRANPADAKRRVFLFQLMCVLGQWDRALTQLNVAAGMDPSTLAMAQTYREAIRCELFRSEVFEGRRAPLIFGAPEEWVALGEKPWGVLGRIGVLPKEAERTPGLIPPPRRRGSLPSRV